MEGFSIEPWNGLLGPAGMPEEIVAKLNTAVNDALSSPDVVARLQDMTLTPRPGSPDDFREHIAAELERWQSLVKTASIPLQ